MLDDSSAGASDVDRGSSRRNQLGIGVLVANVAMFSKLVAAIPHRTVALEDNRGLTVSRNVHNSVHNLARRKAALGGSVTKLAELVAPHIQREPSDLMAAVVPPPTDMSTTSSNIFFGVYLLTAPSPSAPSTPCPHVHSDPSVFIAAA